MQNVTTNTKAKAAGENLVPGQSLVAAEIPVWRVLTVSAWRTFYSMKTEDVSEKRKTICIKFSSLCLYSLPLGGWRG